MAQLSGSAFLSKWLTLFADNSSRLILESTMREFRQDLVDSYVNKLDDVYKTQAAIASGTDTYTATASPAITAYSTVSRYFIQFTNANTGAATLDISSVGATAIVKNGSDALVAGDISAGQILLLAYDGTNFQIIGGTNTISGGTP